MSSYARGATQEAQRARGELRRKRREQHREQRSKPHFCKWVGTSLLRQVRMLMAGVEPEASIPAKAVLYLQPTLCWSRCFGWGISFLGCTSAQEALKCEYRWAGLVGKGRMSTICSSMYGALIRSLVRYKSSVHFAVSPDQREKGWQVAPQSPKYKTLKIIFDLLGKGKNKA